MTDQPTPMRRPLLQPVAAACASCTEPFEHRPVGGACPHCGDVYAAYSDAVILEQLRRRFGAHAAMRLTHAARLELIRLQMQELVGAARIALVQSGNATANLHAIDWLARLEDVVFDQPRTTMLTTINELRGEL